MRRLPSQKLKGEGAPGRRKTSGEGDIAAGEHVAQDVMFGYPAGETDGFTSRLNAPIASTNCRFALRAFGDLCLPRPL